MISQEEKNQLIATKPLILKALAQWGDNNPESFDSILKYFAVFKEITLTHNQIALPWLEKLADEDHADRCDLYDARPEMQELLKDLEIAMNDPEVIEAYKREFAKEPRIILLEAKEEQSWVEPKYQSDFFMKAETLISFMCYKIRFSDGEILTLMSLTDPIHLSQAREAFDEKMSQLAYSQTPAMS